MAEVGRLSRLLLASSSSSSSLSGVATEAPVFWLGLLVTVAVAVVLILVLVLCACVKPEESKKNGITLTQVTPKTDRKSTTSVEGSDKQNNSDSAVGVTENGNPGRHSDGLSIQVPIDQDAKTGSRTEKRALPQVPALPMGTMTDEEEDGNYDVIPHSLGNLQERRYPTATAASNNGPKDADDNTSSLYFEVTEKDPNKKDEPPYNRIISKGEPPYNKLKSPTPNSNPYVKVKNVGTPSYASVSQRAANFSGAVGEDENYAAVAPPVPDKRFSGDGEDVAENHTGRNEIKEANSPDLPPRNLFLAGGDIHPPAFSPQDGGMTPPDNSQSMPFASSAQPAKREPPYSEVTARESISSIRQREENERKMRNQNPDALYESVNYDQIENVRPDADVKFRKTANQNTSHRESLSSELYAEINAEPGDNSSKSATYQRVNDVRRDTHAPTPPPVESLKHLSLHGCPDPDDNSFDPGYAKINKRSTIHQSTVMNGQRTEEELGQMYATVDKSHKRSQSDGSARGSSFGRADLSQLYAQVDRSAKKSPSPANPQVWSHEEYEGTGARPKIRTNARLFSNPRRSEKKNSQLETEDPAYDTVKDLPDNYETINIDPGYEKVKVGKTNSGVMSNGALSAPTGGTRMSLPGDPDYDQVNIDEIMPALHTNQNDLHMPRSAPLNATNHNVVHEDPWLRREPLYQEIIEPEKKDKEEKSRKSKRSSHTGSLL